jgi:hypothetical protein
MGPNVFADLPTAPLAAERVEALLPRIAGMLPGGNITTDQVEVHFYQARPPES